MPEAIVPMKATLADRPPTGGDWLFEVKWDGVRAICHVENERVRMLSRNGMPLERQYPELAVIPHFVAAKEAVLDGEIAVLDEHGVPRFQLIQPRVSNTDANAIAHLARSNPAVLFAFDLLYLDGYDLRKVRLLERKEALRAILTEAAVLRYSEHFPGAGEEMLQSARDTGLEGVMAKHATSCYESRRSREWLKLKVVAQQELLICGFTAGEREYFSSLVLGVYEKDRLVWVGNVGTGFNQKSMELLYRRLEPLVAARCPFERKPAMARRVTWVRPELVCMVKFANWTDDNKLRAPVYLGLREDVDPKDVRRE